MTKIAMSMPSQTKINSNRGGNELEIPLVFADIDDRDSYESDASTTYHQNMNMSI